MDLRITVLPDGHNDLRGVSGIRGRVVQTAMRRRILRNEPRSGGKGSLKKICFLRNEPIFRFTMDADLAAKERKRREKGQPRMNRTDTDSAEFVATCRNAGKAQSCGRQNWIFNERLRVAAHSKIKVN